MDHPSEDVVSVVDPPVVTTGHACEESTQETVDAGHVNDVCCQLFG